MEIKLQGMASDHFVFRLIAKNTRPTVVAIQQPAIQTPDANPRDIPLKKEPIALLRTQQGLVSPFSLGDVTGDAGTAHDVSACVLNWGNTQGYIDSFAGFADPNRF